MPKGVYLHKPISEKTKRKMSLAHSGNSHGFKKGIAIRLGVKLSGETKEKISISKKGKKMREDVKLKLSNRMKGKGNPMYGKTGILSPVWIENRTNIKIIPSLERRSSEYLLWRKSVCVRDNWKCKINNQNCKGKLEVHHILGFKEFPELRFNINNGITLCHFHHPRVRKEEKRLSPYFMELVSVSKD